MSRIPLEGREWGLGNQRLYLGMRITNFEFVQLKDSEKINVSLTFDEDRVPNHCFLLKFPRPLLNLL